MNWNKLLRTTPMSTALYIGAKFLIILLTGVLSLLVLFAAALVTGRVHMEFFRWFVLLGYMLLGMLPFAALGIFLGFIGSASLTQAFSTLFAMVLSFASGFFLPLQFMPTFIQDAAPYLPTYHLVQLAYAAVGATQSLDSHPLRMHFAFLAAYALVFAMLGSWAYIRDENRNFA